MQQDKCPQCGGELEFRREDSVQGYFCKSCDWALVTSFIPDIQLDETVYEVRVNNADYHSGKHIKVVAEVATINFLTARKLLQEHSPVVFRGEAVKVTKVIDVLKSVGLSYEIQPPYPY